MAIVTFDALKFVETIEIAEIATKRA